MKTKRRLKIAWDKFYRFRNPIREIRIRNKWRRDKRHLPLTPQHKPLYVNIHRWCWYKLRDFPDLVNCRDFNDRIQWLKLFDQQPLQVACCDKIRLKTYIETCIGPGHVPRMYQVCKRFEDIDFNALPDSFVIKTNHDSGSVLPVRDKSSLSIEHARKRINKSLDRSYGWIKGEWSYALIEPLVLVEQHLAPDLDALPPDYKFYCVSGVFRFCHYISGRGDDPREQIVDATGQNLGIGFDPDFKKGEHFLIPTRWADMTSMAETLAAPFKFVRVDMYVVDDKIYVGELTFWPKGGVCDGTDQITIGQMLDFDRSTFKPIHAH